VGVANPNLREEEAVRRGMVPFERVLVSSYRPSIVTFPLSIRLSEILLVSKGALNMRDVKMTDVKLTDRFAGHEIAGHENAGMK